MKTENRITTNALNPWSRNLVWSWVCYLYRVYWWEITWWGPSLSILTCLRTGSPVVRAEWSIVSWSPGLRGVSLRQYVLSRAKCIAWSLNLSKRGMSRRSSIFMMVTHLCVALPSIKWLRFKFLPPHQVLIKFRVFLLLDCLLFQTYRTQSALQFYPLLEGK